jgi:hypothetical protein
VCGEEMMMSEPIKLLCNGRLVGVISRVGWLDFPWKAGDFAPAQEIDAEVRKVIDWFGAIGDADELTDPPFPEQMLTGWTLERANGDTKPVDVPIIDLEAGTIEWN